MVDLATESEDPREIALRDSLWIILVPVVRLMLRNGMQFHEVVNPIMITFLDEARKFLADRGLPATPARLQILTGVTRKYVDMYLSGAMKVNSPQTETEVPFKAGAVLTAWVTVPKYIMPMVGTPLDLPVDGPANTPSFRSLVQEHAPSLDFSVLLEEFIRVGNVRLLEEYGTVRIVKREYAPRSDSPEHVIRIATHARKFMETLEFNSRKEGPGKGLFERTVTSNMPISTSDAREFDALLRVQGQKFLEELDHWLSERQPDFQSGRHVGAEIFYFSEEPKVSDTDAARRPEDESPQSNEPIEIDVLDPLFGTAGRNPR